MQASEEPDRPSLPVALDSSHPVPLGGGGDFVSLVRTKDKEGPSVLALAPGGTTTFYEPPRFKQPGLRVKGLFVRGNSLYATLANGSTYPINRHDWDRKVHEYGYIKRSYVEFQHNGDDYVVAVFEVFRLYRVRFVAQLLRLSDEACCWRQEVHSARATLNVEDGKVFVDDYGVGNRRLLYDLDAGRGGEIQIGPDRCFWSAKLEVDGDGFCAKIRSFGGHVVMRIPLGEFSECAGDCSLEAFPADDEDVYGRWCLVLKNGEERHWLADCCPMVATPLRSVPRTGGGEIEGPPKIGCRELSRMKADGTLVPSRIRIYAELVYEFFNKRPVHLTLANGSNGPSLTLSRFGSEATLALQAGRAERLIVVDGNPYKVYLSLRDGPLLLLAEIPNEFDFKGAKEVGGHHAPGCSIAQKEVTYGEAGGLLRALVTNRGPWPSEYKLWPLDPWESICDCGGSEILARNTITNELRFVFESRR